MVDSPYGFESFMCGCCGRQRPARLLADFHLKTEAGVAEPLCRQCEDFLAQGLESVLAQIQSSAKLIAPGAAVPGGSVRSGPTRPPASRSIPAQAFSPQKRTASSTETELLRLKYLALERFIEGFVRGLEASGLDRRRLSGELNTALNSLLKLKQAFVDERSRATTSESRLTRAEVRRLLRHMDESALTVEEYVHYISQELTAAKPARDLSRPCRPPT